MENDIFTNDIFEVIEPPYRVSFKLCGTTLPTDQNFYFVAKWEELFERYSTARIFLTKATEDDWDYWFNPVEEPVAQKAMEYKMKSNLYEMALINYNILVDLSWTWTYSSAEYLLYKFDQNENIKKVENVCGMHPIDEAIGILREIEKSAINPDAEGSPFAYLKKACPEFSDAVDTIKDFWEGFSGNNIRILYNYIKHRGKPVYEELEALEEYKTMDIFIENNQYPSSKRDVQKVISVDKGVQELIDFDNQLLFPYINKLLEQLKKAVNPSPMAYL